MSEYQFIHFLAIDRPLDEKQLAFMRRQSSRAEVSRWKFTNEYHYGDFRGDALEMLRRGFDVHLHFANYGTRLLMFRLPGGLPCDRKLFEQFAPEYGLTWHKDKSGPGGVLEIQPEADAGTWNEDFFDTDELLPTIAPVWGLLVNGDLRPLYIMWLACNAWEEDVLEPPVPAGMGSLPESLVALAKFYEISQSVLDAVAERSAPAPETLDQNLALTNWLSDRSEQEVRELAQQLLIGDPVVARAEIMTQVRTQSECPDWPVTKPTRTTTTIHAAAKTIVERRRKQIREKLARDRIERLKQLAADPDKAIALARSLVKQRSTTSYELAAQELADLREALNSAEGNRKVAAVATKLFRDNPTLNRLKSALRKKGLAPVG